MSTRLIAGTLGLLTGLCWVGSAPESWTAMVAVPGLLWAPGRRLAARFTQEAEEREIFGCLLSLLGVIPGVFMGALLGAPAPGALAGAAGVWALGEVLGGPDPTWLPRARFAVAIGVAVIGLSALDPRNGVLRPLEQYWYLAAVEEGWQGELPRAETTWSSVRRFGELEEDGGSGPNTALRLVTREVRPALLGPATGPYYLVLQAPAGAIVRVGEAEARVRTDVVEQIGEGPVPRYLDVGVTSLRIDTPLNPGEKLDLYLSMPGRSVLYLLPSAEAAWALHGEGELRHVHYYQLLNMVEQLRWARELLAGHRWVTDVQPPLWSWPLAAVLAITQGGLPSASVLLLGVLMLLVVTCLLAIRKLAPTAPSLTWVLPAAAALVHARLLFEPGSQGMPDSLYAFGLLGAAMSVSLTGTGGDLAQERRVALYALVAQLSRYPGLFVVMLMALLGGRPQALLRSLGLVGAAALAFGIAGALTGELSGWVDTVGWEVGPEHWHGDYDPVRLIGRIPTFFGLWLLAAGGAPLLAALRWPRATRISLGAALLYALVLGTIDHSPSHYLLPLVWLSVLALATTVSTLRPLAANLLCGLGLLGLWMFSVYGTVS